MLVDKQGKCLSIVISIVKKLVKTGVEKLILNIQEFRPLVQRNTRALRSAHFLKKNTYCMMHFAILYFMHCSTLVGGLLTSKNSFCYCDNYVNYITHLNSIVEICDYLATSSPIGFADHQGGDTMLSLHGDVSNQSCEVFESMLHCPLHYLLRKRQ